MMSTANVTTARITGHGRPAVFVASTGAAATDRLWSSPTSSTSLGPASLQLPSCVRLGVRCASSASSTTVLPCRNGNAVERQPPGWTAPPPFPFPDDSNDAFDPQSNDALDGLDVIVTDPGQRRKPQHFATGSLRLTRYGILTFLSESV